MKDLRSKILEAGLATLREYGYAGFTQTRVAARAGLRQSHLTYYYPTRSALFVAVGQVAVERQRATVNATFASLTTPDQIARVTAKLITRHDNTRVLLALAQAGDEEPDMRELFQGLSASIINQVATFLERTGHFKNSVEIGRSLHNLSMGLAVGDLASRRPNGEQYVADAMQFVLTAVLESGISPPDGGRKRSPQPTKKTTKKKVSRPPRS